VEGWSIDGEGLYTSEGGHSIKKEIKVYYYKSLKENQLLKFYYLEI